MGLLRLLLATAVVVTHTGPLFGWSFTKMTGGQDSVQIFYVVSGFYMQLVLRKRYAHATAVQFWALRAARLYPVYWCVLALSVVGTVWLNPHSAWREYKLTSLTALAASASNLLLFGQDWLMFGAVSPSGTLGFDTHPLQAPAAAARLLLVPQAWSLGVELTFYLFAPFLLRGKTRVLLALCAASLGIRYMLVALAGLTFDPWTYRFFPCELLLFLSGALTFRAIDTSRLREGIPRRLAWSVLGGVLVAVVCFDMLDPPRWLGLSAFLLILIPSLPIMFEASRDWPIDRMLGELSYPLYIFHILVARALDVAQRRAPLLSHWVPEVTLVVSLALAATVHVFVQRPIDAWRARRPVTNS